MMCPPCGKFSRRTVCPPYTSMPSSFSDVGKYGSTVMMLSSDRSPHATLASSLDVARMRNFGPADCHQMIVMMPYVWELSVTDAFGGSYTWIVRQEANDRSH
ncbi:hypothetical protein EJB05_13508, partial [Eragrostis curvula]